MKHEIALLRYGTTLSCCSISSISIKFAIKKDCAFEYVSTNEQNGSLTIRGRSFANRTNVDILSGH